MSGSYKRRRWKWAGIVLLVLLTATTMASGYEYHLLKHCRTRLQETEARLELYRKSVYVADTDLPKGTVLSEENVHMEERYTDSLQEEFISDKDFGMVVIADIKAGTYLMDSMVCSASDEVREVFLDEVELAEHLESGNRIDVRIRFSNAEDYVVLADKVLERCESNGGIVLKLTEKELLLLSSAIADCYKYKNTRLYAVKYPEDQQTETGCVTYVANREILAMLGMENTEEGTRIALEKRLEQIKQ